MGIPSYVYIVDDNTNKSFWPCPWDFEYSNLFGIVIASFIIIIIIIVQNT